MKWNKLTLLKEKKKKKKGVEKETTESAMRHTRDAPTY